MTWRVARSLDQLLKQLNERFPLRNKASDGSIGDAAHASRASDHNPWYGPGIVTARDFTHDVVNGPDGNWLAETLAASRDPRIKYIIWNRRILDTRPGNNPWKWMPYTGTNPHTKHVHVSVMPNASADDTTPWNLRGNPHTPTPGASRLLMSGDMITFPAEMNTRSEVISLPPDANVKLIFSAKTTIFGGHIYFWSAVNNAGTGGDPVQFRVEPKQGGVINVPRGTTKAEITYSCATPVQVFIQAIA